MNCQAKGSKNHLPSTGQEEIYAGHEGRRPDYERHGERKPWRDAIEQGEGGRSRHDHDVERQNVEIAELVGERDKPDMGRGGVLEHGAGVVPVKEERLVEIKRRPGEDRERQQCDQHLRRVDFHHPAEQAEHDVAQRLVRALADDEAHRPARQKDEELGAVGDRYVARGKVRVDDSRNVIDEDRDEGEASPEVDLVGRPHVWGSGYGDVRVSAAGRSGRRSST